MGYPVAGCSVIRVHRIWQIAGGSGQYSGVSIRRITASPTVDKGGEPCRLYAVGNDHRPTQNFSSGESLVDVRRLIKRVCVYLDM